MKRKPTKSASSNGQKGYILLSVMLVMVLMLIALTVELPRIAQQIKREKEEELVHRGREYATAIKRFYHKNGTYPVSLDQLESTNNIRFLRRRFKDPMTESGEFKLVHLGEAQINVPMTAAGTNANQGSALTTASRNAAQGSGGSNLTTSPGGLNSGTNGFGSSGFNTGSPGGLGSGGPGTGGLGSGGQAPGFGNQGPVAAPTGTPQAGNQPATGQTSTTGQMGTLTTQNIGNGMIAQGGGAGPIIGVASTSKKTSIKEFNGSNEYDEWMFVYDPRVEQVGAGGVVVASPIGSATGSSSGIPQPVQPVRTPTSPQ